MNPIINFSAIHPTTLAVFGMFLLCGVLGGILASRLRWMPTITAFMLLGLIIGPYGLGLITKDVLLKSSPLVDVALGLILYKLGTMLHPKTMMRSKRLLLTSMAESVLAFVFVFALMLFLQYDAVLAGLVGAIAVSASPAVLVHVSEELRAKGPVTERAKSLVAMNNLLSFMIFSAVLPFALASSEQSVLTVIVLPFYRMLGAAAIGVAVAWVTVHIGKMLGKNDEHYRFAIIIGAVTVTLGLSEMFATSTLLSPLVLGIAIRWMETAKNKFSRVGLGEGGDLFFIVLFVMAGAKINPALLISVGWVPVFLVIARCIGKFIGVFGVARYTNHTQSQSLAISLLLIPMAGMAIGLVTTTTNLAPEIGNSISILVFAMVAIFETIGPFAAAYALRMAGEAGKMDEDNSENQTV